MNRPGGLRRRVARWLDPTAADIFDAAPADGAESVRPTSALDRDPAGPQFTAAQAWPALCEQFALRILAAAYQTGGQLAEVEADEQDPGRLAQFYRIDHANTRIRRQAENLLVLAGRPVDDAGRQITSLIDVARAATSAIEHYPRVRLGVIAHLAVVDFAADDVIRVLTEVLDNATRFSPPSMPVTVSAHLTEAGSVLLRVEDTGLGFTPGQLADVNAMLASAAPHAVNPASANRLGLLVVQRLAAAHRIGVRLTARPGGGTTATALLPAGLLCEIPSSHDAPNPHALSPAPPPPVRPVAALPPTAAARPAAPPLPRPASLPPPARPAQTSSGQPVRPNPTQPVQPARPGPDQLSSAPAPAVQPPSVRAPSAPPRFTPPGFASHQPPHQAPHQAPHQPSRQPADGPAPRVNGSGPSPAGTGSSPNGLPRREPASLRGDLPAPPLAPTGPTVGSDQLAWPDETLDFATGFRDGFAAGSRDGQQPHPSDEGHRDDQPAQ
ncbi:histidine kinase/DNA gyrase B/HSP90-like ATPase [Micromonospora pisi]|uniref:histidine kinase n=1 Tax=Micromonospora pisi TaxID=589240 RepID=A0A495JGP0_9ACTN|nr:ATP-binding protein [Micromonospora pisi]RKR87941.1 histidine kinase/DNA gyrase B/HSP90-like ATPase [Micromonospora pisi]